jgi:hypothetical protein
MPIDAAEGLCAHCLLSVAPIGHDPQRFIHGMPGQTLSAEQNESLRQVIRDPGVNDAIKLYRQMLPEVSQAETCAFIGEFIRKGDIFGEITEYRRNYPGASLEEARNACKQQAAASIAELKAKYPEKFAKRRQLNWRKIGLCLAFHVAAGAVFWGVVVIIMPSMAHTAAVLSFADGFFFAAGAALSMLLMVSWKRFLGVTLCLALAFLVAGLSHTYVSWWGIVFGALFGQSFGLKIFGASFMVGHPTCKSGIRPSGDASPAR